MTWTVDQFSTAAVPRRCYRPKDVVQRRWTAAEEAELLACCDVYGGIKAFADRSGRSKWSVYHKSQRLRAR